MWRAALVVCALAGGSAQQMKKPDGMLAPPPPPGPSGGPPTPPPSGQLGEPTMSMPELNPTDMPPHLAAQAYDVDFGKNWDRVRFHYQNNQEMYEEPRPHGLIYRHNCLDQFIACMLAQSAPEVVCAYNNPTVAYNGYWTAESYCHVFYDNCRRRYRAWYIVDTGACMFYNGQLVHKDRGFKSNQKNHKGWFGTFPFGQSTIRPFGVTDPELPPQ